MRVLHDETKFRIGTLAERPFRQGAFRGPRSARIEAGIVPEQG
jgi:hypothetical protein